jgi:predicted AAA+ superfamily ATPase
MGTLPNFLMTQENKVCELIQVSYSINNPQTYARETNSLLEAGKKLNCGNLKVVTFNEERNIESDGKVIRVTPAWKWFLK